MPSCLMPSALIQGNHEDECSIDDTATLPFRKEKKCAAVFMAPVVLPVKIT